VYLQFLRSDFHAMLVRSKVYKLQWRTWEWFCYSQFAVATETKAFAMSPMHVLLQLAMAAASNRTKAQEDLRRED